MKRRTHFPRRLLLALALAAVALPLATLTAGGQPGKDGSYDPFNEAYKAPPLKLPPVDGPKDDGKKDDGKKAGKADDNWQPKDPPARVREAGDAIDFEVTVTPKEVRRGQVARVTVTGMPRKGWYTYSMTKRTPDQFGQAVSKFKPGAAAGLQPMGPVEEVPEPELVSVPGVGQFFEHRTKFTWSFEILVAADAKPGTLRMPLKVELQVCSKGCIPGEVVLTVPVTVQAGDAVEIPAAVKARASQAFPPPAKEISPDGGPVQKAKNDAPPGPAPGAATVPHDYAESIERVRKQIQAPEGRADEGLLVFILTGMFWGFVSLITPCVFPMIPITVSFFLKQSEKEHHKPVAMAAVYCGTIVVVLTIAAAALLSFFRVLSINPVMNFGLGCLFIFFALSLFGMYEIELPSFLARYTSERESKGGYVGTIFMALTFTIISFACVAPFLGGFGGTASTSHRPLWHTVLGGLAFSLTFASPFFILALFPTLLKAMPKSGAWLNSVKVVMGFLELAAALKFFRAGELVLPSPPGLFTFDLVLGLWIALCVLCGAYLLGLYRLPHDSPVEHLTVPRMLFALAFLGLALYLTPALVGKPGEGEQPRPNGAVFAWVNSFLLPEPRAGVGGEVWSPNLEDVIAQAREYRKRTGKPKLVFVDFTGEVCTNCSLNENNVFSKAEIQKMFKSYALAKLYCDTVPLKYYAAEDRAAAEAGRRSTDAKVNYRLQSEVFDGVELPLYVILEPLNDGTIRVVAKYDKGLIDEATLAEFLRRPQEAAGASVAAR
jgi:thiol:disulfide interchange protein DsbD